MDFETLSEGQLKWLPSLGVGYYEVKESPYDQSYFNKYVSYEGSEICTELNNSRVDLVKTYSSDYVLDIGIGSGSFIKAHGKAYGYDINPAGVAWLKERDLYMDPKQVHAVTFWDSFEHIRNPADILNEVTGFVFMSIPLFNGVNHILRSKHFRKDEHYWYFTQTGLVTYMSNLGFLMLESNRMESDIGREDIGSFVFKRIK